MADRFLAAECRESYFEELKRRDGLTKAITIPIAVLSIIGGILFYVVSDITRLERFIDWTQLTVVFFSVTGIGISIYYLVRSYFNYPYEYAPTILQLRECRNELKEYNRQYGIAQTDAELDENVYEYYYESLAKSVHRNTINNDSKSGRLHLANLFMIVALVLVFIAGIISVIDSFPKKRNSSLVQGVVPLCNCFEFDWE